MLIRYLLCARHYTRHAHVGYFTYVNCGQGNKEEEEREEEEKRINLSQ